MKEPLPVATLDANIFVHAWTLDVILSLADARLLEPLWSEEILSEARAALLKLRPNCQVQIDAYLSAACAAYPFSNVPKVSKDSNKIALPDENDVHVANTSIAGGAQFIVTYNVKDFPESALKNFGITAIHPDEFLCELFNKDESSVLNKMRELISTKKHPPRTIQEELEGLRKNGLHAFANLLEDADELY